jgi:hypothetical protein
VEASCKVLRYKQLHFKQSKIKIQKQKSTQKSIKIKWIYTIKSTKNSKIKLFPRRGISRFSGQKNPKKFKKAEIIKIIQNY